MKEFQRSVWLGWCFTVIAGTLLHFLYAWTQENRVVGLYSAISESTWEHLKLLFFPSLAYTIWEYLWIGHRYPGYVLRRFQGTVLGMLAILALFYTYTGICGTNFLPADILVFLLGTTVTARYTWRNFQRCTPKRDWIGVLLFAAVAVCFGICSLWPPRFGMFLAP